MLFDPMFFVIIGPALLLALWAQFRVQSTFSAAMRVGNRRRIRGADAAREILDASGLQHVRIERSPGGTLSDHYDPRTETVRLSPEVFDGASLAAVGIAAHECGHAMQKQQRYPALAIRNQLVPLAATGGTISAYLFMFGLAGMAAAGRFGAIAVLIAIGLYAIVVLMQLVNLPVEFDASRRAKLVLVSGGIVSADEMTPINRVLSAAALTYVAATLQSVLTLLYYLYRSGLLGGRRN